MRNQNKINLGEGNTPLIRLYNLEKKLNWKGLLWAKCEFQNPTGSFKDRGTVFEINQALKQNKLGVVCASTGNMAASLSSYSARVQVNCIVVVPKNTPSAKLKQTIICGAKIIKINGDYDKCVIEAIKISKEKNYLLCGDYTTRRIGQRSIGVELANSTIKFDSFVCPVGNGTVGSAIAEGFATKNQSPSFIGIQGVGADPLTIAWKSKKSFKPILDSKTIASAMNVGNPLDGKLTIDFVKKTEGSFISVSNKEIISAQRLLAQTEGLFVESSAAATVAGLKKIKTVFKNTVLIFTGNGLKENNN